MPPKSKSASTRVTRSGAKNQDKEQPERNKADSKVAKDGSEDKPAEKATGKQNGLSKEEENQTSGGRKRKNTEVDPSSKKQKTTNGDAKSSKANAKSHTNKKSAKSEPSQSTTKPSARAPKADAQSKKKTMGSKHDDASPPAAQASNTRLPEKGQAVTWKAMPGWVEGTVLEVATQDGSTEGKNYKASKDNPTIVLRAKSGKICAHKAKAVYFD